MCINTGLAEAGLENIEPQKGTETVLRRYNNFIPRLENIEPQKGTETINSISLSFTSNIIREYRTPEGDGN